MSKPSAHNSVADPDVNNQGGLYDSPPPSPTSFKNPLKPSAQNSVADPDVNNQSGLYGSQPPSPASNVATPVRVLSLVNLLPLGVATPPFERITSFLDDQANEQSNMAAFDEDSIVSALSI